MNVTLFLFSCVLYVHNMCLVCGINENIIIIREKGVIV